MTVTKPEASTAAVQDVFARTPTGVVAVCAEIDGLVQGFVVSSFVGISIEPPLVGFFVQERSTTWPVLIGAPALGLSLLGTSHGASVGQMARKGVERFDGVGTDVLPSGAVVLRDAVTSVEATLFSEVPVGDHRLVVLRVREVFSGADGDPLVYLRSSVRDLHPYLPMARR
jgi:flavin reductase (DIM6/NTAB) family NADH-FMN oxidoreductase RutF